MTVQSADTSSGTTPASFELKSAQLTLVTLVVKTVHLEQLAIDLEKRFGPLGESPDFFDTDGLVIDFAQVQLAFPDAHWDRLCTAFERCRLVPVAVRGLDASSMLLAKQAGLLEAAAEIRRNTAPNSRTAPATPFMPSAAATASSGGIGHGQSGCRSDCRRKYPCVRPFAGKSHGRGTRQYQCTYFFALPGT
jgi:septum site-determining protein MinC